MNIGSSPLGSPEDVAEACSSAIARLTKAIQACVDGERQAAERHLRFASNDLDIARACLAALK